MAERGADRLEGKKQYRLSAAEARAIAIRAQGLALTSDRPKNVDEVLRRVGAVQLDTIAVLARSHELAAYARLGPVGRAAVEEAYWGEPARAFEYIAHANCVLPIGAWPYFAFRRQRLGRHAHHKLGKRITDEVRARLREAPLTVSDLGGARQGRGGWWNWSEAKFAARGDVPSRRGRLHDAAQLEARLRPARAGAAGGGAGEEPSTEDCYRYLVQHAIRARGVGTRRDIANYFRLLTAWASPGIDRARLLDEALAEAAP